MKIKNNRFCLIILALYTLCVNRTVAQDGPITWREGMEYAKVKLSKEAAEKSGNSLVFIGYTYKGAIDSEVVKSAILDSIVSYHAPFPVRTSSTITSDTIYSENAIKITRKEYPNYEIITGSSLLEISNQLPGITNILGQLRQQLDNIVQIGFEYLEIEWEYKGKKIHSLCIVSGERFIYENIASRLFETTSETIHKSNSISTNENF